VIVVVVIIEYRHAVDDGFDHDNDNEQPRDFRSAAPVHEPLDHWVGHAGVSPHTCSGVNIGFGCRDRDAPVFVTRGVVQAQKASYDE